MDTGITSESGQGDSIDHSAFGRAGLVGTLVSQIDDHLRKDSVNIEPSLVVGVLGEWGSGKSTILQALNDHYDNALENSSGDVTLPVFFNPWRFESEVHLIVPLLKTAQACVKKYLDKHADSAGPSFKESVVRLGQTAVALASAFKGKVSILGFDLEMDIQEALNKEEDYLKQNKKIQNVDFDSIYFDLHNQIEQITARDGTGAKLNMLFLIDDLDRCLPEKAVQVMESVKLFLDARGCAFVLALDEEVVERGIVHRYRDYLFQGENKNGAEGGEITSTQLPITGAEYLEKIIQLPIHLPRPDDTSIRKFLMTRFPKLFQENQSDSHIQERINQQSKSSLLDLFVRAIPPIPRKLVRAATLLEFLLSVAKEQGISLDQITLARLVMLQLFAPELYRQGKRQPGFLSTMERWAKIHGTAWSSKTTIDNLLEQANLDLKDQTKLQEFGPNKKGDKVTITAESIITIERDREILKNISRCTQYRSEFNPSNIIDLEYRSDTRIARYFTFIEKRSIDSKIPIKDIDKPEAHISNIESFVDQLVSKREDAWLNAIQSEIDEGQFMPQSVFEMLLERLDKFPTENWLAQVAPVMIENQRIALREKFNQEYQRIEGYVSKAPFGRTENNSTAGQILGWLGDSRRGVGLDNEGLPDIDWIEIKAPNITYLYEKEMDELWLDNKGNLVLDYNYKMARYPVTWIQFQSFIDHPDGYQNNEWWKGLDLDDKDYEIFAANWPMCNHPRDTLNWFQCVAFCRWFNKVKSPADAMLISLPTEWEWQYAASGGDIENFLYPWGDRYQSGYANIHEIFADKKSSFLGRTTAVGLYPLSDFGLADMSGNVLEWCINKVENEKINDISLGGTAARALRGGSWFSISEFASTAYRFNYLPDNRFDDVGFRLVCVPANRRIVDQ